ncbi:MAG: DinB family protein [Planctomycetes bacterium]|nr:DinB family protein [Planctomycetota bacterium]
MDDDLKQSIAVLERTPHVLRSMLSGLDREWTHTNYGEDTFSPFDVVGHLITGEKTDWIARARIILECGPARPFDSYDRYAQFEASRGKTLEQLLSEFELARTQSLRHLREMNLTPQDMLKKGTHPILGEVTLAQLLATWVVHDLNHIAQIAKCMATQYVDAVGPWKEYLGVLKSPVTRMSAEGAARRKTTGRQ